MKASGDGDGDMSDEARVGTMPVRGGSAKCCPAPQTVQW